MIKKCQVSQVLAYAMLSYCIASLWYYFNTKSLGTPFRDSLNGHQIAIKKDAVEKRKKIFMNGIIVAIIIIIIWRPFKEC